jgi:hypothetical protein
MHAGAVLGGVHQGAAVGEGKVEVTPGRWWLV